MGRNWHQADWEALQRNWEALEGIGRGIQGGINAAEQYSQLSVGHLSSTREWQQHFAQSERSLIGSICMYFSVDERI